MRLLSLIALGFLTIAASAQAQSWHGALPQPKPAPVGIQPVNQPVFLSPATGGMQQKDGLQLELQKPVDTMTEHRRIPLPPVLIRAVKSF